MNDQSRARQNFTGRRILVVDDDRDFADTLYELLKLEGHVPEVAHSASAAQQILKDFSAEIALIDIRLGEGSGLSLVSNFRTEYPKLTCIMMTAYASIETAVSALQEAAYDYLRKPFFTQELMATIDRCLERSTLMRDRDKAEAALKARNLDLEVLNIRLKQLVQGMQNLSTCGTRQELCAGLVEQAIAVTNAENGSVALSAGGDEELKYSAGGTRDPLMASSQSPDDANRQLEVPIPGTGQDQIGTLIVEAAESRPFTEQDRELAQILVSYASEAIRLLRALERVSVSEVRLRNIIDNSPSLISLQDLAGRLIVVNRRFEEWLGCSNEDSVGKIVNEVLSPETARLFGSQINKCYGGGPEVYEEIEVAFADGSVHAMLMTSFPVLAGDGTLVGTGTIATDVTDHRRTEEHLRQARKMESLGHLTGGVAHDFNNLLAVISGNLSLLAEDLNDDAGVTELIEDALSAVQSGAGLTNQLLAFSRRQTLRPQHTDAYQLLDKMCRVLRRTLGEAIVLKQDLSRRLWPIEIDRSQLETSLLNLALNARDAMPQGGSLQIAAENLELDQSPASGPQGANAGKFVVISVSDTGTGMAADVMEHAVQPYFTTKDAGHGSGLGLSMVDGFAEQSGGYLDISSTVGQGTTVRLFLPRANPKTRKGADSLAEQPEMADNGERVLVVEDQPSVRRLAKKVLTRLGYDVLEAGDAATALAMLADSTDVDLLLTDIVLPGGMSGVELAETAQAHYPDLKTLYTSGYARGLVLDDKRPRRDIKLVPKPFQTEQLAQMVRSALDG